MKGKPRWLFLANVGLIAGMLSGCSLLPQEEAALQPPLVKPVKENFQVVEVQRGNITKQVSGVGTFASDQMEYSYFRESGGRMKSIHVRLGDVVQPGDVVAEIESGDIETRIKQQQITLEKAEIALEQVKETNRGDVTALRLKMLDLQSAQLQYDLLLEQRARMKLVANRGGVVTYVEPMKEGDAVTAYRTIVTISDPSEMRLVYQATALADLAGVEIHMDVDVKVGNKNYIGKVVQIPSTAPTHENKAIQDRNARSVIVRVDDLPGDIKIGAQADITIVTQRRDDVLLIPRVGLRSYMGRDYVQVLDGESRKEIDVEKGIVGATQVEIRRGLEAGQKVILNN